MVKSTPKHFRMVRLQKTSTGSDKNIYDLYGVPGTNGRRKGKRVYPVLVRVLHDSIFGKKIRLLYDTQLRREAAISDTVRFSRCQKLYDEMNEDRQDDDHTVDEAVEQLADWTSCERKNPVVLVTKKKVSADFVRNLKVVDDVWRFKHDGLKHPRGIQLVWTGDESDTPESVRNVVAKLDLKTMASAGPLPNDRAERVVDDDIDDRLDQFWCMGHRKPVTSKDAPDDAMREVRRTLVRNKYSRARNSLFTVDDEIEGESWRRTLNRLLSKKKTD